MLIILLYHCLRTEAPNPDINLFQDPKNKRSKFFFLILCMRNIFSPNPSRSTLFSSTGDPTQINDWLMSPVQLGLSQSLITSGLRVPLAKSSWMLKRTPDTKLRLLRKSKIPTVSLTLNEKIKKKLSIGKPKFSL